MKKIIISIVAIAGTLSLTNCVGLAVKGADEGSQIMAQDDNELISGTGKTIQKGVQPINEAKDDMVDAVKGAFE
jgi:hypothetical protein